MFMSGEITQSTACAVMTSEGSLVFRCCIVEEIGLSHGFFCMTLLLSLLLVVVVGCCRIGNTTTANRMGMSSPHFIQSTTTTAINDGKLSRKKIVCVQYGIKWILDMKKIKRKKNGIYTHAIGINGKSEKSRKLSIVKNDKSKMPCGGARRSNEWATAATEMHTQNVKMKRQANRCLHR